MVRELTRFLIKIGVTWNSKRIAELIVEDGWLKPPCKVGEEVYRIVRDAQPHITKDRVLQIRNDGNEWGVILVGNRYVAFADFGTRVFTDRKDAELTLEGEAK